jgi:uncharacterized protein involved in exopolysaccharide biosynthesis
MAEQEQGKGLQGFVFVLARRAWLIALCALVGALAAGLYSNRQPNQYTASASLLFRDARLDQTLFGSTYFGAGDPTREAATNTKLVSLEAVADRTAKALGRGVTASQVQSAVQVTAEGQSNVVSITATQADPQLAALIPNTFAEQYIVFRRDADRAKVRDASNLVRAQLARLTAAERNSPSGRSLEDRAQQLEVLTWSASTGGSATQSR